MTDDDDDDDYAERFKSTADAAGRNVEFVIQGNYAAGGSEHDWEDLTTEDTPEDALRMLKDYDVNETEYPHRIIIRKVEGGNMYDGAEDASIENITRYLIANYDGVDKARADQLIGAHAEVVHNGIMMRSHARYVGDQIAEAEKLDWIEDVNDAEYPHRIIIRQVKGGNMSDNSIVDGRCERATPTGQCPEPATEEVEEDGFYCATHAAEARAENGEDVND